MKLTTTQIRKLIKEELRKILKEMDYSESMSLDLGYLQNLANQVREKTISNNDMQELIKAVQLIGNELFAQKLNPNGEHAMFYYKTVGLVDPDVDMYEFSPEEEPEFY